jgi:predicted  nucleic acid-binding Zn-ribbon protein
MSPPLLESLRQLVKVQAVDDELAIADAELAKLPGERSAVAAAIQQAKDAIAAAQTLRESEELEERRLEADMREQEALMERLTAQSGQVTSTQAYEALEHEMGAAHDAGSAFETRALELMEAIDRAGAQLSEAERTFGELEGAAPAQLGQIAEREQRFQGERSVLLLRREKETDGIERDLFQHYERIAARYAPAVVVLPDKACPKCQMAVPAQRAAEIRRAEAVYECGGCRRLLVCPGAAESDEVRGGGA